MSLPRRSIGVITPSANVVVEWTGMRLLRAYPDIGLQFARIPVRGAIDPLPDGYDMKAMQEAARLLADARPQIILWAGSKGALVGIEKDEALCAAIEEATGVAATTPTLALREMIAGRGLRAVLVTPYTQTYQTRLIAGLSRLGVTCVSERHAGIADNLAYASVEPQEIAQMIRAAASGTAGLCLDLVHQFRRRRSRRTAPSRTRSFRSRCGRTRLPARAASAWIRTGLSFLNRRSPYATADR